MSDRNTTPPNDPSGQSSRDAWQDVGRQFQQLGESLAQAVRTAWNDEENRRKVQEMQNGLESMVNEVGQAIRDTAQSPEGQRAKETAQRTVQTIADAGEQTVQEVRPHLINALQQLNEELQKFVNRMESNQNTTGTGETTQKPPSA